MIKKLILGLTALPLLAVGSAHAASLTMNFNTVFGSPTLTLTSPPWLTAVFDDACGAGCVNLTLTAGSSLSGASIESLYFNSAVAISTITPVNILAVASQATSTANNFYTAATSGKYDIQISLPTSGNRFMTGEMLSYQITGSGLGVASFNVLSDGNGGLSQFFAAAKLKKGSNDAWVRPESTSIVPLPAAVWLLGSAIGLLGWVRRKVV